MKLTIAAKKIDNTWEGALIAENKFQRALVSTVLEDIFLRGIAGIPTQTLPEGTDVVFEITTETPDEAAAAAIARHPQQAAQNRTH